MSMILDIASSLPVVGGIVDAISGNSEKKQINQQKKLMDMQMQGAKEMAQINKDNQMDIWNKTNYGAQMEHLKNAGLNPALLYGKGGVGGATTGGNTVAMPTGGTAASVDPNARTRNIMDASMMLANKALIESQTKKNEAEAAAISGIKTEEGKQNITESGQRIKESEARVTSQEFQNKMNQFYGQDIRHAERDMAQISAERKNLDNEMYKAVAWGSGNVTDENNLANRALRAEFEQKITDLSNAKKEGRINDAEAIIREFGANMAKEGLAPNSPWYVKMIDTLLNKAGIHVEDTIKNIRK